MIVINQYLYEAVYNPVTSVIIDVDVFDARLTVFTTEACTVHYAVHASATGQRSEAEIDAGTGAVSFGSFDILATPDSAQEILEALSEQTSYRVHYYIEGAVQNSAPTMTEVFTTLADLIYMLPDDFRAAPDMPAIYADMGLTTTF